MHACSIKEILGFFENPNKSFCCSIIGKFHAEYKKDLPIDSNSHILLLTDGRGESGNNLKFLIENCAGQFQKLPGGN